MGKMLYPTEIGDIINNKWEVLEIYSGYVNDKKNRYLTVKCVDCGIIISRLKQSIYRSDSCKQCEDNKQAEEMIGKKYNMLTVLELLPDRKDGSRLVICKCDCGSNTTVKIHSILSGRTISCGCRKINHRIKHGLSKTRQYGILCSMKDRCYNENNPDYKYYGGKGIKICDEWLDPDNGCVNFYNWSLENGYEEHLTIDRIDPNSDYCPENCRWITIEEQQRNKTTNLIIDFMGYQFKTYEISELFGILITTVAEYHNKGKLYKYMESKCDEEMIKRIKEYKENQNYTYSSTAWYNNVYDQQYFIPNEVLYYQQQIQNAIDMINYCKKR